jgi:Cation transporter/ATPase, N-terminus
MRAGEGSAAPSGSANSPVTPLTAQPPVTPAPGLSTAEAARRLSAFGPNQVVTGRRFQLVRTGLGLLANPLVLILLVASVVSSIVGEALDAGIIVAIVLVSVGLDFFQIFHSDQAARKLQSLAVLTTRVWRDGQLKEIPVREVVPGDAFEVRVRFEYIGTRPGSASSWPGEALLFRPPGGGAALWRGLPAPSRRRCKRPSGLGMMCSIVSWSSVTTMRSTTRRRSLCLMPNDGSTNWSRMCAQKIVTDSLSV